MSDRRRHRGAHPADGWLFAGKRLPDLRAAVADLSLLSTREYPRKASLKLVGDRYALTARQRVAVSRSACSDAARDDRQWRAVPASGVAGKELLIDGFNVLTTVEAALSGGVILAARDGCFRDMASMHGSYRAVDETKSAVERVLATIESLAPARSQWFFDQPVSNSGRLKGVVHEMASRSAIPTTVTVVPDPDPILAAARSDQTIAATADSAILDACGYWFNLARQAVESSVPGAWVVSLG